MNKIWTTERSAIILAVAATLVMGTLLSDWSMALILTLSVYIFWLYARLLKFERWLSRGTKASEVYDESGLFRDIILHLYQQKKMQNKRKKSAKEILRRLNRNIAALPDATVLLNDQLEIEWSNAPALYLLGINNRYDIGQRISNLIRHPKFLRYLISPDKKNHLEMASYLDPNVTLQFKIVRFGKNQRLLTARNVSDQKQLQEGLKNFVANASHELKTPLTVICGHLEMIEQENGLSKSGKKSVQIAQQQSLRMKHLIQDLLLLSRVESYQLQLNEGDTLHIDEIMTNVMSAVGEACNQGRIKCSIPEGLMLLGIKAEIEGICINLIDNAIKYSQQDAPIKISWQVNSRNEYVFSVKDRGFGISEQDLAHITDRYYRGNENTAKQIDGSGLGLSIVERAASKHGATLDIKSQINQGSTFSVTFPSYRVVKNNYGSENIIQMSDY